MQLKIALSRDDFNLMCRDLISLMIKPLDELLGICEMDKKDINEIVMVGGMTKMPSISNNVETSPLIEVIFPSLISKMGKIILIPHSSNF